ncbi:hypothetical protein OK414_09435 [Priestia sp. JV24]|jgi:hypothetical protein|uniref:hypothetical protein n=1 Tax=Priestia TaxID=2800373 RepID=UPI0021AB9FB6|nr:MULTISPECIES: hypothetical protein [Priestia]MCR8929699.1 hypothetical protein [Priestia megaterium]MCU7710248.1 hypothetical protein [Priestia megaterium]MCW1045268.1 hypothetical protein [Priestia sp. JV24]
MEQQDKYANIDLTKIHEYSELPDKKSERCDNCDGVNFKNSVGKGKFLRECLNCGMKKYI